jgi:hypothetical protein
MKSIDEEVAELKAQLDKDYRIVDRATGGRDADPEVSNALTNLLHHAKMGVTARAKQARRKKTGVKSDLLKRVLDAAVILLEEDYPGKYEVTTTTFKLPRGFKSALYECKKIEGSPSQDTVTQLAENRKFNFMLAMRILGR